MVDVKVAGARRGAVGFTTPKESSDTLVDLCISPSSQPPQS